MKSVKKFNSNGHWREESGYSPRKIALYKYGKLIQPSVHRPDVDKGRPGLISAIHHLLSVHGTHRIRNEVQGKKCPYKLHKAIYKVLRMCFEHRICESKLFPVSRLLLEIYKCEGNLQAIFSILFMNDATMTSHLMHSDVNILYPGHVDDRVTEEDVKAFEYYVKYVSTLVTDEFGEYYDTSLDLINKSFDLKNTYTPLLAATMKRNPDLVLILLRYGANPFVSCSDTEFNCPDPTEYLLNDLNGLHVFKNSGFSENVKKTLCDEETKASECFRYFRRAVPNIHLSASTHIVTSRSTPSTSCEDEDDDGSGSDSDNSGEENAESKEPEIKVYHIHPSLAANLDLAQSKCATSLQHMCRCAVREVLSRNPKCSIPSSIARLPLPGLLKQYIDLLVD